MGTFCSGNKQFAKWEAPQEPGSELSSRRGSPANLVGYTWEPDRGGFGLEHLLEGPGVATHVAVF